MRDVGKRRWRDGAMVAERDTEKTHTVMRATGVPPSRLRPGTVVLARVPFEDGRREGPNPAHEGKLRPVVVVRVSGCECVCRPCTSAAPRSRYPWAYTEIEDLDAAGLGRPTAVRRAEVSLTVSDCLDVCGALAGGEFERVFGSVGAGRAIAS
ncbi:MAG: hypothetical protein M3211_01580 [Actinomycetota bacterium]|nr:hypothetical protein [Actinomycetota bacterium]